MALIVNEKIIVLDKDGEPTILYNGEATYPINYNNLIQEYVTESKKYYETLDSPVDVDFSIAEKSKARFGVQANRPLLTRAGADLIANKIKRTKIIPCFIPEEAKKNYEYDNWRKAFWYAPICMPGVRSVGPLVIEQNGFAYFWKGELTFAGRFEDFKCSTLEEMPPSVLAAIYKTGNPSGSKNASAKERNSWLSLSLGSGESFSKRYEFPIHEFVSEACIGNHLVVMKAIIDVWQPIALAYKDAPFYPSPATLFKYFDTLKDVVLWATEEDTEEEEKFPSQYDGIVQRKIEKSERSSTNLLEEADFKKLLSSAKSVSRASGREQLTLEAFLVASVGEFQADISKELTDKIKILAKRWKLNLVANKSEKNELTLPLSQDAKEFIGRHKKFDTHTFIADLLDNFQSELDGAHDDKDVGELEKLPKAAVVMLDEDQGATQLLEDSRFKILLEYTKLLAEKNNCDILTLEIMACACIYFHVDEMPLTKDQERFIKDYAKTNDINLLSLDLSKNIKKTFKVDDQLKSLLSHHKRDDFKIFYGQVLATFYSSCGNSSSDDNEEPDEENPSGTADKNNKSSIAPINSKKKKSNKPEPAVYAPGFEEFFQCVDNFARYLKSETVTWEIMAGASVFLGELKIKKQSADLLLQRIVENKFDLVNFDNSKSYGNYKIELESTLADFISGQENADFDSEFIPSLVSSFLGRSEKIQSLNASKKEKVTSLAASGEKHVNVKKLAPEKPKSSRSRSRVAAYIGVICLILYSYNFYLGNQGSPENRVETSYSSPSTAPKVLARKTARKPRTAQPPTDEELEKNAQSVTPEIASSPGSGARGYLGVQIQSITPEIASAMGLKEPKGFIVINVGAGGPAAKAGFEQGDVVTAIDGKSVEDASDLVRHLESAIAGTSSDFTIDRQGQSKTVKVMIEVRPEEKFASNATATPSGSNPPYSIQPSSPTVSTNAAVKPSFDCGISLTDIEKIICGNSELSSLDAQVTSFYRTARMAATYPKVILEEQRKWLLDRNACGTLSCLVASYRARRDYLGQWVKPNP